MNYYYNMNFYCNIKFLFNFYIILYLFILCDCNIFNLIHFSFLNKFKLNTNDVSEKITHINKLPRNKLNIIKEINGFYGLIGPNIKHTNFMNISSLHDLFGGDGIVQGVFFNNGELTFVRHFIKTEKILFEEKFGIVTKEPFIMFIFYILNKMNMLPNMMGLANTALLSIKDTNNIYALFEQDYPYHLKLDFKNNQIKTIKKQKIELLEHFSAHSKINKNLIETIDYKMNSNIVNFFTLNNDFKVLNKYVIPFKYLPIIHDFYSTNNNVYLIDAPLTYDFKNLLCKKLPIILDNKKTYIYVLNKLNGDISKYESNETFYIFHYGNVIEHDKYINIYGSIYDNLDFNNIDFEGKYRMIQINKHDNSVSIHKNRELEKYNLDFPIHFEDKLILLNMDNKIFNGFIIVKNMKIHKKLFLKNKHICGEHNVIYVKGNKPFLIFFNVEYTNSNRKNYLTLICLRSYESIDIELHNNINLGFHSIFLDNSLII